MFGGNANNLAQSIGTVPEGPQPQVLSELNGLNQLSDSLLKGINELENKLSGILRGRDPRPETADKLSQERVPLAQAIAAIRTKLNTALDDIYSIQDRVEL